MSRIPPSPLPTCRVSGTQIPKLSRRILATSIGALLTATCPNPAHAADVFKDNNTNVLNTGSSWVGGSVPGASDIAVWDNRITAPNSAQIGGDLTLQGIKITNVGGTRNASNIVTIANSGTNNNSTFTLTLGSAGIDMSAATQALAIQSKISLSANQTWNIANANTSGNPAGLNQNEDLALLAQAANTPMNLGGFTVTKTGAGTAAYSSGWNISNGAFVVNEGVLHIQGGASRVTTVNDTVNFTVNSGATLRFAAQSGAGGVTTQNNAPITLNTGSTFALHLNQNNAINLTGNITAAGNSTWNPFGANYTSALATFSGNLLGSGNIAYQNTATNTTGFLRFTGNNSGYSGTITLNGASGNRILRLTGPDSGSAAATWIVDSANILQVDGQTVAFGKIGGAGTITNSHATNPATINVGAGTFTGVISDGAAPLSVTKVGTGTLELLGFNTYSGPTTVNAGTLLFPADPGVITNVTVADGAGFGVKLSASGGTLNVPSLSVETTTGGTIVFDLGNFGNPIAAGINTNALTISAPTKLQIFAAGLTPGTFQLLDYAGTIGGLGVGGLTLVLPPRVTGSLVSNTANTSIDVNITGKDTPKWTGATNGKWDIQSGTSTGTSNWKEIVSGNTTQYMEGTTGSDVVLFDDTATGTTAVELTTTIAPADVTVNNTARAYTFSGAGKLTGATKLAKTGTGTLTITNTGTNDYSGGTVIDGGTVQIGDGTTAGAGSLGTGAIDLLNGSLVLNRPDDFTLPSAVNGAGSVTKNTNSTATIGGRAVLTGPVTINAGTLRFTGGGDIAGVISGAGGLTVAGGTLLLSGSDPNTFTGDVNVTAGVLQLTKAPGSNAFTGNITIAGTGQLQSVTGNQIPDTATITHNSDGPNSTVGADTFANAVLSPVAAGATGTGQLIVHTGLVITDTLNLNGRIFAVASGHSATVNRVVMTAGTLRIAANSNASTLDIGPGGITASGGIIEVGNGTGAFDAVLNLGGNLTTTGNLEINRGGFTGLEKREINIAANRTFNIGAGTTTNVRPEIAGEGGLTKAGGGTLNLLGLNTYLGPTNVSEGTLITSTTQTGTSGITIADNANLQVRVAFPGSSLQTSTLTLGSTGGAKLTVDIGTLGNPTVAPIIANTLTTNGATTLTLVGALTAGTFPLIDYQGNIAGGGFSGLTLKLPIRVVGGLVQNTANSSVDIQIAGIDTPKWIGNVSADWDIDNGTGTGTANWKEAFSGNVTRYLQGSGGTDSVLFDDSAVGNTSVNLTSALTPVTATVNNTARAYEFGGTGKLSGAARLIKQGTGTLTVKTDNDFTGGTTIEGGTLNLGGGTNAGTLGTGPITNNGTLVFNRSGNFIIGNAISGTGTIIKRSATNDATLGAANPGFDGPIQVEEGRLSITNVGALGAGANTVTVKNGAALYFLTGTTTSTIFNPIFLSGTGAFSETTGALRVGANNLTFGGAITLSSDASIGVDSGQTSTISGIIGGNGNLTKSGAGTLAISGFEPNTYSGLTNVAEGTLQLNMVDGVNSIPGNAVVNGGTLSWLQPNQIPDTASITVTTGAVNTGNRADTLANLTINSATPTSTFSGLNVTGTLTVTAGVHDAVNSNGVMSAGKIVLSNTNIRLGTNSGPSTLSVGAGGITMTDAIIQFGQTGNAAQTALLNLGGNVTASGTNLFDINTGNPISQLDLGSVSRIFDILLGVTTIEPSIQSSTPAAGITKAGSGSLVLMGTNTYTGDTIVQAGTLDVRGSIAGSANLLVKAGAILDVSNALGGFRLDLGQTLTGAGTINGSSTIDGILAPGEGIGTLQFTGGLTLAGTATYELNKNGLSLTSDLANVSGLLTLGGALNVTASGSPLSIGDSFNLFDAGAFAGSFASLNLPTLGPGLFWDTTKLSVDGTLAVIPEPGSATLIALGSALIGMRRRRRS